MIITGENLKALIQQHGLVAEHAYDQFSITLTLDNKILRFKPNTSYINYGEEMQEDWMEEVTIADGLVLKPGQSVLACSTEIVSMPKGYIGMIQTKGSLARLFVMVHCCDSQVESGFNGKITFEICNIGGIAVKISSGQPVAQMFVYGTSCDSVVYDGKYNQAKCPTASFRNYNSHKK